MDPADSSPKRTITKGSTAYDPHFEGHLNDHGIFMPSGTYPDGTKPSKPENIAEILKKTMELSTFNSIIRKLLRERIQKLYYS
ncbi:uncharacterized protein BDV14DRAFT_13673 [Aspergillus stella-maris]|uniref:uncharacterized protein n=1 Tax=Aspergillus stella-maris TaxID=1810926 RepID=UPI003CCD132B